MSTTVEGDPVPHFARVIDGGVEVVSTLEYDAYGSPGWYVYRCTDVADVAGGPSCDAGER